MTTTQTCFCLLVSFIYLLCWNALIEWHHLIISKLLPCLWLSRINFKEPMHRASLWSKKIFSCYTKQLAYHTYTSIQLQIKSLLSAYNSNSFGFFGPDIQEALVWGGVFCQCTKLKCQMTSFYYVFTAISEQLSMKTHVLLAGDSSVLIVSSDMKFKKDLASLQIQISTVALISIDQKQDHCCAMYSKSYS